MLSGLIRPLRLVIRARIQRENRAFREERENERQLGRVIERHYEKGESRQRANEEFDAEQHVRKHEQSRAASRPATLTSARVGCARRSREHQRVVCGHCESHRKRVERAERVEWHEKRDGRCGERDECARTARPLRAERRIERELCDAERTNASENARQRQQQVAEKTERET